MDLENKKLDLKDFEVKSLQDDPLYCGEFKGRLCTYGVPDNGTARSRSDIIEPGAFKAQLAEWAANPGMLKATISHDMDQLGGVYRSIVDTPTGPVYEGLFLNTARGRDLLVEVKTGAMSHTSLEFEVGENYYDNDGIRHIKSFKRIPANSFVPLGSQDTARVEAKEKPKTARELEGVLLDSGFSHTEAKKIIAKGYADVGQRDAGDGHRDDGAIDPELKELFKKIKECKYDNRN
jgi:HK97 family phage prohead protease